jgi:polyhydroxybutyrate depolymerase
MKYFMQNIRFLVFELFCTNSSGGEDEKRSSIRIIIPALFLLIISSALYGQSGVVHERSFLLDGVEREYLLYVPDAYNGQEDWPLVINYHGFTIDASTQMDYTDMNSDADTAHFLIAYPEGLVVEDTVSGSSGSGWNVPGSSSAQHDDIAFTDSLIHHIDAEFSVDLAHVHATGLSNGSEMAFYLACVMPDRIASVAGVSGGLTYTLLKSCQPKRSISALSFFGTDDFFYPFEGNEHTPPVPATTSFWASHNNCSVDSMVTDLPDVVGDDSCTVTLIEYQNCEPGIEVLLYRINDGGHNWPGSDPPGFEWIGHTNQDIDANSAIWNFFKRNPHPNPPVSIIENVNKSLNTFYLFPNYPNPFNPSTTIEFTLPKSEYVELKVYNILGKEVTTLVSKKLNQGNHTNTFDGKNLASGVYYYRLEVGNFVQTRKMVYLK